MALNFGTYGGSTGSRSFPTRNASVTVSNFSQNGLPKGSFNSVSIDKNGNVSINYSNGTNKIIAADPDRAILRAGPVAADHRRRLFRNPGFGQRPPQRAGRRRARGTISSSSLEESNVDISTEFTNLIQAQQVYSANAKVVTTDDSMLQVTLNMIQ